MLIVLVLAGGGLFAFSRNVWFLGTNNEGLVTLYRGFPYELPLGVRLYQQRYVSGVPALSLRISVSLRKHKCMMRRSRLLMGLKWNGRPVCFTRSAAATALKRSSSMRSKR